LTARGESILRKLALYPLTELRTGAALASSLTRVIEVSGGRRRPKPRGRKR